MDSQQLPLIGWREWVKLPKLGITRIKAKVDTGARSSSIHAVNIEQFVMDGVQKVRFQIAPVQHDVQQLVETEAILICQRTITDSGGHQELRPVIKTTVSLGDCIWPIELTLTNRDVMGFRMLLGRQAIRDRFLVHSGHSFLQSSKVQPEGTEVGDEIEETEEDIDDTESTKTGINGPEETKTAESRDNTETIIAKTIKEVGML